MITEANTAKEKMEALLAGKEVWQDDVGYRLEGGAMQVMGSDFGDWLGGDTTHELIWDEEAMASTPAEKHTFCQAIGMMAKGKVMSPVGSKDIYRIDAEYGLVYSYEDSVWVEPPLYAGEIEGMWVEVEE